MALRESVKREGNALYIFKNCNISGFDVVSKWNLDWEESNSSF